MNQVDDTDITRTLTEPRNPAVSEIRPAMTYRSADVFVAETAPALAHVGPLGTSEDLPPHAHDFIEITVVAEGRGSHIGPQGTVVLEPGTVVVVRPGAWHAFREARDVIVAMLGISSAALSSDLAFLRARPSTRDLLYAGPLGASARGVWVTEISPEAAEGVLEETGHLVEGLASHPADTLLLTGRLIAALGRIAAGMSAPELHQPPHPAVAVVLERLESAPERPWTITELAAAARLDQAYLSRLFRADVGVPPIAYLARIRAEKAANLLTVSGYSVQHIGAMVGWPDPAYFSRRFHALIGLSPSDYRRRMSADGPAPG